MVLNSTYPDTRLLIDGLWQEGFDSKSIDVVNPATGQVIGTVAKAARQDLDQALTAAAKGFDIWCELSTYERSQIMRGAAMLLRERKDMIALLLTMEQGKPVVEAKAETANAADTIEWFAEEGRRAYGRVIPSRAPNTSQTVIRLPVGPVAAFTPWNFPINQVVRKVSAALAAGCSIIVKASEETPASTAELVRAFVDAGLPAGVVNLIYGDPAEISGYLIPHSIIRKISFTGSTVVGKNLASLAGQHMKRATMELGGHAPAIVLDDADLNKAVTVLAAAKYRNAGQVCVSPTRFLVQENVFDAFVERFSEAARSIRVGNGLDSGTQMGPVANARRIDALETLVADALEKGAKLKTGGRRVGNKGYFFEPTVLIDVPSDAQVMNTEPFGPLAVINPVSSLDDAIAEGNRLPYGLASYAFTSSPNAAHELGIRLQAGMLSINHNGIGLPEVPFGGVRDSGYGSEGGSEALEPYLISKLVTQLH